MPRKNDALDPDAMDFGTEATGDSEFDNMVLDLDQVSEDVQFEALPPGIYNCIVENTEFGPSKSSGNPMITWVFKVIDEPYVNRLLFNHTTLNNDMGKSRLKKILLRVVPDVDMSRFNPARFCDEGVAIGLPCRVKVRIRPYQGQKRNDVTDVLPPAEEEGGLLDDL